MPRVGWREGGWPDTKAIIRRMKTILALKRWANKMPLENLSDSELSHYLWELSRKHPELGIASTESAINKWRQRRKINIETLVAYCLDQGIDLHYLVFGEHYYPPPDTEG